MGRILITVDGRPVLTTHQLASEFGLDPTGARTAFRRAGLAPVAHLDGRTPLYAAAAARQALTGRPGRGGPGMPRPSDREPRQHGGPDTGASGQAREWMAEHNVQVLHLAGTLVDWRDELAGLVDGPARDELLINIDAAGELMVSPRATVELLGAVALAVHLLRPGAARPVADPEVAAELAHGLALLW
jgi:hypothetical protein